MAGKQEPARSNSEPKLPKGHFDSDGKSQGKQEGAVRKTPDAYQGPREKCESK